MKKRICQFLIFLLLFLLTGCGSAVSGLLEDYSQTTARPSEDSDTEQPIDTGQLFTADSQDDSNGPPDALAGQTPAATDDASAEAVSDPDSAPTRLDAGAPAEDNASSELPEDGSYTSKEDVALYICLYGRLPSNFITKKEAEKLGWKGGSLEAFAPGMCIGGNRFGNYEGALPEKNGRIYTECDIDTLGADKRGAKRIVFSNDGLIYYTEDHYESFELLYGEE